MNINSNKGMLLESIIETSINWINTHYKAWFTKQDVPIKIKKVNNNKITGILYRKSNVDYYGIYHGKFICFEAKQTNKDKFYLNNIKDHQRIFLQRIFEHGGIAILIIMFTKYDAIYLIDFVKLKTCKVKGIDINWCSENGFKLELIIPGRIDILSIINQLINNK